MIFKYIKLIGILFLYHSPALLAASETHEFALDNGLRLIVREDHRAPVVVSQVWYKVGGSYEQTGKTGLSHMLEHMMFKGTQKYGPGEFSRIMAAQGANENAFTSMDYTAYFQTLEKSRLALSFEMEADRMRGLMFDDKEFVKEQQVVLEERRTRVEDQPNSLLYEQFKATAFQTSPYRQPLGGWKNDIENYTLVDLKTWYQRWYTPNNAIVVVVGDVEPQAVFQLAQQHFGVLETRKITSPLTRPEIKQMGIKRLTVKRPAKLPYLIMGYKTPILKTLTTQEQWQAYALEVLAYILDGGDSSRLSKNLVRGQQIATVASTSYGLFSRLTDLFSLSGVPAEGHTVADLEKAFRAEILKLQTTPVEADELERIKVQLRAAEIYERDSLFYQGMKIGMLETIGLDWQILETYLDHINQVTAEQIQAVARQYLVDDQLTVAILEPQPLDVQ